MSEYDSIDEALMDAEIRMEGAEGHLHNVLREMRTGRASVGLVERLMVTMYGTEMTLQQLASISVPEPQQLAIRPYDANSISAIERAIQTSNLSLTPNNDGKIIRLNIPPLTEERRRMLARTVGSETENARIAVRNVRRDVLKSLKQMETDHQISEDAYYNAEREVDDLTKEKIEAIDKLGKEKEAEIMEV